MLAVIVPGLVPSTESFCVLWEKQWGCNKPFPSWPRTVSVQNKVIYLFLNQFRNKLPWLGCVSVWLPWKRSKASSKLSNKVTETKTLDDQSGH